MRESKSMKPVYVDIVYLYLYKYTIVYHSIHATKFKETPNIQTDKERDRKYLVPKS